MSETPKRLHEEGSHPTTSKRPHEESSVFSNLSGKLIQPIPTEYHLPFESGQGGRLAKVQRIEPRDGDKRSILFPLYRISSTSNGSCLDHPAAASESRPDLRESKDNRDAMAENRETKEEIKELFNKSRMNIQGSKGENDLRPETRGGDKEVRSDRECRNDFKTEIKMEKDGYNLANSQCNWKESKEHHRLKRYSESPSDGLDPWRVTRHSMLNNDEVGNEVSTGKDRESLEGHEAVGENKVDLKGEEKSREKERKMKDEKHRDWGERDKDRNDRRNNLQLGSFGNDGKNLAREERESERWERDRKDAQKEKERRDREKDPVKRESLNTNVKESGHHEKELVDGSVKISEQERTLEPKRLNEFDPWKGVDREAKDKKRERDLDVEADRHERRCNCDKELRCCHCDKELDDGCAEVGGVVVNERDREVFGYGVQQHRRMLRPRWISQASHREPHFLSHARDNEGSQGKSEVSTVVYKVGECMQELLKLWKEFEASEDYKKVENHQNGPTLEIRIPAEYVTATNRQVRSAQLWGTDIYTDDSDLVAVLMHTGYCRPTASPPPSTIHELRATICLLPPQDCYTSTLRNNVRSRAWGVGIGCSFRVERCCIVKKIGGTIDLEPRLTHLSAVGPTLAPVSVERTMTTRAAASNALRQQRFVREVPIQYNLCNEPWVKYSINVVADKGLKKPFYTSASLKKGEVLYLETHMNRYELCFNGEKVANKGTMATSSHAPDTEQDKSQNPSSHVQTGDRNIDCDNIIDVFRWSRCRKPLPQKVMRSIGIPLPVEHLEVLEENLDWEDVQWSQTGVWIAGKEYMLARIHFLSPS